MEFEEKKLVSFEFIQEIKQIIKSSRKQAVSSVEFHRVQMYWKLGERIFVEEQNSEERSAYGKYLIGRLASELTEEFGAGYSVRQLSYCRQFYRIYPIVHAVRAEFNWFQYRLLLAISDEDKRIFYEQETLKNAWNGRELERQINSHLFERLLLSSDKESVMAVAKAEKIPITPTEIIKDPIYLEFLGLEQKSSYYEKELEASIINHLQDFLLELGNGFSFVARQKRIIIEEDVFFIDLVFYNRLLRCFIVIELKTNKITHQDLGQLQMYVNYYDRLVKLPEEKATIGILLCPQKNNTVVELTLPEGSNIFATEYQLYLPPKSVLENNVDKWIKEYEIEQDMTNQGKNNE